ncbi:LANO_0C00848g1_1 [Lachancea nothofagi CBS 11611]|uniref:Mitochondrial Rho GTPase n=1 Tax=Lachancea nothofagi CBS 11611 TaxID=1266666 RepID=A0A1G4J3Y7_9SACH|nr:LANO_0C00848g1_1 [Lachancea nothofagi CBS 11611]
MAKEQIKVVVCGDDSVGKTSLIACLVKDQYIPNLQDFLPPVTIPRDFSSSPYCPKNSVLVDTTSFDLPLLHRELKSADVIWLVYSDHESYDRVALYWMMMFRSLGVNLPVILCKNKCDSYLEEDQSISANEIRAEDKSSEDTKIEDEEFIPILREFKEIETCIKTSARDKFNVNQAFYLCQRAITHPIAPLFDARVGELKPLTVMALKRIFLLSDKDQDGFLNDEELSVLQKRSFSKTIDIHELEFIKKTLVNLSTSPQEYASYTLFVPGKGITKDGFLVLNKLYSEKGRHETTWGILRAFHYTDSLSISDKVLYPKMDIPDTASVELSPLGYRFLVELFLTFDKDNDGGLNDRELEFLFKTTPGIPKLWSETNFPFSTVVNSQACVTLQGWLAQWTMTTFLDYRTTTEYLVYLGIERDARLALQVTKSRKKRRRNGKLYRAPVTDRKVFNCFVVGKPYSGKSSLLESFVGMSFSESYSPTIKPRIGVNSLELKGSKQYYLILQEFGEQEPAILENVEKMKECDVLCLTYDSSDPESFSCLFDLINQHKYLQELPMVFVALKADLDKQQQRCYIQPDDFTDKLFIDHPLHVSSAWSSSLNELFIKLTEAGLEPAKNTPGLAPDVTKEDIDYWQYALVATSAVGFTSLFTFTFFKFFRSLRSDTS